MGWRGTAILALLVVLGAAYLSYKGPPPSQRPEADLFGGNATPAPTESVVPLLTFSADQVVRVVLTRDGKQRVASRLPDSHIDWTGAMPRNAINDFLDNLTHLGELMRIEGGLSALREYGLEPPRAEIELQRRDGAPVVVLLGDRNPATTGAYVRIGRTGPVVLAGALMLWEFDKAFKALEDGEKSPSS